MDELMAALLNPSAFIKGMKGAGNVVQRVGCSPSTQSTLGFNHSTAKATHWWHTARNPRSQAKR